MRFKMKYGGGTGSLGDALSNYVDNYVASADDLKSKIGSLNYIVGKMADLLSDREQKELAECLYIEEV